MVSRLVLIWILIVQYSQVVSASDNITVSGWVHDPDGRGTFTIISSCLLTLSLCVYTSIHLNVRPQETTEVQSWIETSKWVGFGILAPELLVFIAWRQYASAMNLDRTVRGLKESMSARGSASQSSPNHEPKHNTNPDSEFSLDNPWTPVHSFYANMGGFAFDFGDDGLPEKDQFAPKHTRLTLTPRGMALLVKCGYLPNISKKDILDKSKADNVSKLLSILQALWMLSQILGRLIVNLPVTLLEVNTLAHIICAIIIYLLWWNKPKLITEPTKLKGEWAGPICAYMYMSSQISGWRSARPGILKKYWIDPEMSVLAFNPPTQAHDVSNLPGSAPEIPDIINDTQNTTTAPVLQMAAQFGTFSPRPVTALAHKDQVSETVALHTIESRLQASQDLQMQRWALAAKAMTLYPAIASRVKRCKFQESISLPEGQRNDSFLEPITEELIDSSIGNWARENLLRDVSGFIMGMIVWSASVFYGGLHLAAWDNLFPTPVERLLWRFSALCIASSGITWILINMSAHMSQRIKAYWKSVASLRADNYSLIGLGTLATLCGLAYVLARLYLVVESLISLRVLPKGAFETMQWSQVVPHL